MADVKVIKTAAETALAHAFMPRRAGGFLAMRRSPSGAPPRSTCSSREGLPHRRIEDWKYTDLRALMREAKPLAGPPGCRSDKARAKTAGELLGDVEMRRLVFVDGAFVPELSDSRRLESGLCDQIARRCARRRRSGAR